MSEPKKLTLKSLEKNVKSDLDDFKEAYKRLATEIGKLKGELEDHKNTGDAHNPATMVKPYTAAHAKS